MPRQPAINPQEIVDFILSGKTTLDAKEYFGFGNDNIANLRVWSAFKALGIKRPVYQKEMTCDYCGKRFIARNRIQSTCGAEKCQTALIVQWQKDNPEKVKQALRQYRQTEKGRQNNIRMHRTRRGKRFGAAQDRWHFATDEIKKSLRKLKHLATRNSWGYRIEHIQQAHAIRRTFNPRSIRTLRLRQGVRSQSSAASDYWQDAARAIQTTLCLYSSRVFDNVWEKAVSRFQATFRTRSNIRLWKNT